MRFGRTAAHGIEDGQDDTYTLFALSCRGDLFPTESSVKGSRRDLFPTGADIARQDLFPTANGIPDLPRSRDPASRRLPGGERVRKPDSAPTSDSRPSNRQEVVVPAPVDAALDAGAAGSAPDLSPEGPHEFLRRPLPEDAGAAGALSCLYRHASPYLHVPVLFQF